MLFFNHLEKKNVAIMFGVLVASRKQEELAGRVGLGVSFVLGDSLQFGKNLILRMMLEGGNIVDDSIVYIRDGKVEKF